MKDLFEHPELWSEELREVLEKFEDGENDYDTCAALLRECEAIGYTFEYYLDAVPFDLKKFNQYYIVHSKTGYHYDIDELKWRNEKWEPTYTQEIEELETLIRQNSEEFKGCIIQNKNN